MLGMLLADVLYIGRATKAGPKVLMINTIEDVLDRNQD